MIKFSFDAVIFDIDNVLIDTRASYTDCIRETVQQYLSTYLKFKPQKSRLLSRRDVEQFKLLGGFNDDWDTCYGLLIYLLSLKPGSATFPELKKSKNLSALLKKNKKPLFITGVEKICGKNPKVQMKKVAGIFQKLYWAKYIKNEKPIISKKVIRKLSRSGIKIGIATGRNRKEAHHAFKNSGISQYISKAMTLDDLPSEKFKKPNPYSLRKIAEFLGKELRYLYIGDLPDDIQMARSLDSEVKISAIGFSYSAISEKEARKALQKAGADCVIRSVKILSKLLLAI